VDILQAYHSLARSEGWSTWRMEGLQQLAGTRSRFGRSYVG